MIIFLTNSRKYGAIELAANPALFIPQAKIPANPRWRPDCFPGEERRDFRVKEKTMAIEICWLDDLLKAQETARKVNKPIFLDFYNPQ